MAPGVIADRHKGNGAKVINYPGIKEDVYLSRFHPDYGVKTRLGIPPDDLLVMVRPPATEAHYHNPESEQLLKETINRFVRTPGTSILLLPRNKRQEADLRSAWG